MSDTLRDGGQLFLASFDGIDVGADALGDLYPKRYETCHACSSSDSFHHEYRYANNDDVDEGQEVLVVVGR